MDGVLEGLTEMVSYESNTDEEREKYHRDCIVESRQRSYGWSMEDYPEVRFRDWDCYHDNWFLLLHVPCIPLDPHRAKVWHPILPNFHWAKAFLDVVPEERVNNAELFKKRPDHWPANRNWDDEVVPNGCLLKPSLDLTLYITMKAKGLLGIREDAHVRKKDEEKFLAKACLVVIQEGVDISWKMAWEDLLPEILRCSDVLHFSKTCDLKKAPTKYDTFILEKCALIKAWSRDEFVKEIDDCVAAYVFEFGG